MRDYKAAYFKPSAGWVSGALEPAVVIKMIFSEPSLSHLDSLAVVLHFSDVSFL